MAHERVVQIDATISTDRAAGIAQTLVQFRFALKANETWPALANESLELVYASPSILTRIGCAVVYGVLTLFACVAWLAGTRVSVHLVDALAVVSARFVCTLVDVRFASRASPSRMTDALVAEQIVHAYSIETRISRAQVYLLVASFAGESWGTVAGEVGYQIRAIGSKQARLLRAIVGIDLTALTLPAW